MHARKKEAGQTYDDSRANGGDLAETQKPQGKKNEDTATHQSEKSNGAIDDYGIASPVSRTHEPLADRTLCLETLSRQGPAGRDEPADQGRVPAKDDPALFLGRSDVGHMWLRLLDAPQAEAPAIRSESEESEQEKAEGRQKRQE
jgi:hypothetical protein